MLIFSRHYNDINLYLPQSTNNPKILYESEEVIVVTIKIFKNLYLGFLWYFIQYFRN